MARILIVDDDPQVRRMLERSLSANHQVIAAASVTEADARLGSQVDLIITDVVMPEINGVEAIPRWRKACPQVKVLAISGGTRKLSPSFNLESARMQGADAVLAKPFDLNTLRKQVDLLLQAG